MVNLEHARRRWQVFFHPQVEDSSMGRSVQGIFAKKAQVMQIRPKVVLSSEKRDSPWFIADARSARSTKTVKQCRF